MRQVNRDELVWKLALAFRHVSQSVRAMLLDRRPDVRDRGEAIVATKLAEALGDLEVLSDSPATHESAFSRPVARMMGGGGESGATVVEVDGTAQA